MSFNSNTYHINKYRREAAAELAKARDVKARAATGDAYDWELPRIATFVKLARLANHLANSYARLKAIRR